MLLFDMLARYKTMASAGKAGNRRLIFTLRRENVGGDRHGYDNNKADENAPAVKVRGWLVSLWVASAGC